MDTKGGDKEKVNEITKFFNTYKEPLKFSTSVLSVLLMIGLITTNSLFAKIRLFKLTKFFLSRKKYFKAPCFFKRDYEWIAYDPKAKKDRFSSKMTLIEGHPGTGKSTFIKYQVDLASEIRPALYISFKPSTNEYYVDKEIEKQLNLNEERNKDDKNLYLF